MTRLFRDRTAAAAAADKLRIFAQPQRLMILSCLLDAERNVGDIADATGIGQPALSQQLAELRRADLVRTRREVKQVWYTLADDGVALCVRTMETMFGGETIAAPPGPAPALLRSSAPMNEGVPSGVYGGVPNGMHGGVTEGVAGFARSL